MYFGDDASLTFDVPLPDDDAFGYENASCPRTSGPRGLPIPPSLAKQMQDSRQKLH